MTESKSKTSSEALRELFQEFQSKAIQLDASEKPKMEWITSWMKYVMEQGLAGSPITLPSTTTTTSSPTGPTIIYVDGGQNGLSGKDAWARVVDNLGNDLLDKYRNLLSDMTLKDVNLPVAKCTVIVANFTDVKKNQNNGAELLALIAGLRIAQHMPSVTKVATDSETVWKWWSVGHIGEKSKGHMDAKKMGYIQECATLRKAFEQQKGKFVVQIPGNNNPADLGFHKG